MAGQGKGAEVSTSRGPPVDHRARAILSIPIATDVPPSPHVDPEVTRLLQSWRGGNADALDRLLPALYDEMRRSARVQLRRERADHTLGTSGLVHEAFLRLVDAEGVDWQDRAHFLAVASRTMRRVLVDWAKARNALKRGGGAAHVTLEESLLSDAEVTTILDLDDALDRLERVSERASRAAEMRYVGGLSNDEAASALDVSVATVERDLRFARAWLAKEWAEG